MSDTQLSASLAPTAFQAASSAAGMTWVVFFAVSFLALASNVALAAYQFRKIRKLKLNPLKDELYADTKSYQELEEANR